MTPTRRPGPYIGGGEPVDWVYEVQNTGNTGLSGVSVADDKGVVVTCPATSLAPWARTVTRCSARARGSRPSASTRTPRPPPAPTEPRLVTDTDPSHYYGFVSSIDLQKSTNGQDADTPTGPFVPVGDDVTWNYVVTNTGNIDILSFTVTDSDPSVVIACPTVERILPTQSVSCVASGKAKAGRYENVGTVDALDVLEEPLTDTDPSHYFGAVPAIDVEKATNGQDADAAPGPRIPIGDPVTWTYVVTNKGNAPLTSVTVTDDKVGVIACPATAPRSRSLDDLHRQGDRPGRAVCEPGHGHRAVRRVRGACAAGSPAGSSPAAGALATTAATDHGHGHRPLSLLRGGSRDPDRQDPR